MSEQRGKLKIFFGAAAGVGKTYAMLDAAHLRKVEGVDVVIGYIEPHPRPETNALTEGLEKIAPRLPLLIEHTLEFDIDAALARHPQLILVDELAHTNAPGSRHPKRWKDVDELLSAGIDVYTTMNVQHIESLNDVVAQITGVVIQETVPDWLIEQAHEIELIDLPQEELLKRFREGKVYRLDQAEQAMQHFFRPGNLMALRELALRRTAERVDRQMQAYKRAHDIPKVWSAGERLLVCVSPSPLSRRLVRAAKRMADSLHAEWLAVYVETLSAANMPQAARNRVAETLRLAEQLGAETITLSGEHVSAELLTFARSRNVTKIIVGKPIHAFWRDVIYGSVLNDLVRLSGEIDVYVISGDEEDVRTTLTERITKLPRPTSSRRAYIQAVIVIAVVTLIAGAMFPYFSGANLIMVYLVGVVYTAVRCGRGPSILASVLSAVTYDFFFVHPYFTLAIFDNTQSLLTFTVMVIVALTISTMTTRTRQHAEISSRRERRTASLYAMSREFAHTMGTDNLIKIAAQHISQVFDCQVAILLPDPHGELIIHATENFIFAQNIHEQGVAQWVYEHRQAAGMGTDTLPDAKGLYLPLVTSQGITGVMGVYPHEQHQFDVPEQRHLLETFANQTALAIERTRLAAEAELQRTEIEKERLRNSLLSSVSHDLRTPLASITGAATSLLQNNTSLGKDGKHELHQIIYEEADRLNRLVGNLLDMTRIESGVHIDKEWQLLEEVIGTTLRRLQLKDRPLVKKLPPDLPLIPMDSLLIEQVLVNLIENAIKYSPAETEIELAAVARPDEVEISVADRGDGIPEGMEERIFDKFYRVAPANISGAGLGLAICRGILTAHGGRIWAERRPDGGTIFRFTLPLDGEPPEVTIDNDE